jgi:TFIIIC subunit triple barrel domain
MATSNPLRDHRDMDDHDDWEYEYASDEFEDLYITLDLPEVRRKTQESTIPDIFKSHIPPGNSATKKKRASTLTPKQGRHRRRKRNLVTGELEPVNPIAEPSTPLEPEPETPVVQENDEAQQQEAVADEDNDGEAQSPLDQFGPEEYVVSQKKEEKDDKTVQILDFHTKNPLIAYGGTIYSCHWSTTIGTDMFFAKRPEAPADDESKPLRSLDKWDLLGLSAARLLASEAKLTYKNAPRQDTIPTGHEDDGPQGAFLRRFVDLKVKKGEIPADEQLETYISGGLMPTAKSRALQAMYLGNGVQLPARTPRGRAPRLSTASLAESMSGALPLGSGPPQLTPRVAAENGKGRDAEEIDGMREGA